MAIEGTQNDDPLIPGTSGSDIIYALEGDDEARGFEASDIIYGGGGDDRLFGYDGDDTLYGGEGADLLWGLLGADHLFGGRGGDVFYFLDAVEESAKKTPDVIHDFSHAEGDTIAFGIGFDEFIGRKAFDGDAGQVRYKNGILRGDVNGDKKTDFKIVVVTDELNKHGDYKLHKSDFDFDVGV